MWSELEGGKERERKREKGTEKTERKISSQVPWAEISLGAIKHLFYTPISSFSPGICLILSAFHI